MHLSEDLDLSRDCSAEVATLRSKNIKPFPGFQTLNIMSQGSPGVKGVDGPEG